MANVEKKTVAMPPLEAQQASKTVVAAELTQSQAQAATGPAEVSVAVEQAEVFCLGYHFPVCNFLGGGLLHGSRAQ